jgi:hypothetical protein
MKKALKKRAPTPKYVSPTQLLLDGFHTPYDQTLNPEKPLGCSGTPDPLG